MSAPAPARLRRLHACREARRHLALAIGTSERAASPVLPDGLRVAPPVQAAAAARGRARCERWWSVALWCCCDLVSGVVLRKRSGGYLYFPLALAVVSTVVLASVIAAFGCPTRERVIRGRAS